MAKYRKNPVVIDAHRFRDPFHLMRWVETVADRRVEMRFAEGAVFIPTLEGEMRADPGDWVIRGVKGEFYPCRDDIFEATYEEAGE